MWPTYGVDSRIELIRYIHHINSAGSEGRHDKFISFGVGYSMTAGAGVPASMMEFIILMSHRKAMNHLQKNYNTVIP